MKIKSFFKDSLIYSFGYIIARIIPFALLPLYTHMFNPYEYGIISLVYTFIGFLNVILHFGFDAALMKYYSEAESDQKKIIYSNIYIPIFISTLFICSICLIFRNFISNYLFMTSDSIISLYVGGILFFDILCSFPMLVYRINKKPIKYISIILFNVIGTTSLNIYFLISLNMNYQGVLLSNFIISFFIFIFTLPTTVLEIDLSAISNQLIKKLCKFAIPFLPAGVFSMIIELSDRYFIEYYLDLNQVGIYSAGYKLGMFMLLVVMGFNMAWQPFFLQKFASINERNQSITNISSYFYLLMILIWMSLLFWIPSFIYFEFRGYTLFDSSYFSSLDIVPIISLSYFFHGLYHLQLPGLYNNNQTQWVMYIRGLGALINIVGNIILIPLYYLQGAAISTLLSFISMSIFIYFVNRKNDPIYYNWIIFIVGLLFIIISYWMYVMDLFVLYKLLFSLLFICFCYFSHKFLMK